MSRAKRPLPARGGGYIFHAGREMSLATSRDQEYRGHMWVLSLARQVVGDAGDGHAIGLEAVDPATVVAMRPRAIDPGGLQAVTIPTPSELAQLLNSGDEFELRGGGGQGRCHRRRPAGEVGLDSASCSATRDGSLRTRRLEVEEHSQATGLGQRKRSRTFVAPSCQTRDPTLMADALYMRPARAPTCFVLLVSPLVSRTVCCHESCKLCCVDAYVPRVWRRPNFDGA